MSQEELARRSRLSARAISDLERGIYTTAKPATARLLAEALELAGSDRDRFLAVARCGQALPPGSDALPSAVSVLVGRDELIATVVGLLCAEGVRLLTLTGPGGVGKTRVAVAVARRLERNWPDGMLFVPLEAVRDATLVMSSLARASGVRDLPGGRSVDTVIHALCAKRLLLVLDNFEQILDAADDLSRILGACPGVVVLVTSRIPLHLRAEQVLEVPPLAAPDPQVATSGELLANPAVELFLDRCQAAGARTPPTPTQLAQAAEICRQLDGLPLALELAASRVRLLGFDGTLKHMGTRLSLLTAGPRDAPDRQRTLRSTFDWSHELLSTECQLLFRRLAVFDGGFTLDAVTDVCQPPDGPVALLDDLSDLLDAGLVRRTGSAEGRWSMLQTVHEYATERLTASAEFDEMSLRHAEYFAGWMGPADAALRSGKQREWLGLLDAERGNLRAGLHTALRCRRTDTGLRLVGGLWRYWGIRGELVEGRHWLNRALDLPEGDHLLRAHAFKGAANLARDQADLSTAERLDQHALVLYQEVGTASDLASCVNSLGVIAQDQGHYEASARHFEQAAKLARQAGDEELVALFENNLGLAICQDDPERAINLMSRSLTRYEQLGDDIRVAWTRQCLGVAFLRQRHYQRAAEQHSSALRRQLALGDRIKITRSLEGLAASAAGLGKLVLAAHMLGAADTIRQRIGLPMTDDDPAYHQAIDLVHSALDSATLRKAWDEGRATPPHQFVDALSN